MIRFLLSAALSVFALGSNLAQTASSFEVNERLGRGINMGNAFEAPSENEWGNPWQPEYFKRIADLGFQHVRVPIRWETAERSLDVPPYEINPDFMARIQSVVDTALKYKLHVIINMHHHDSLFEHPEREKARFLSQWLQIGAHFKDYPDSLLFEVLNEPHGNLQPELWNTYFAEALGEIRKTNPTRSVLLGTANFGGLTGIPFLEVPDDDHLILTIHYYNPFQFTHQGAEWVGPGADEWLGTEWLDTEAERLTVVNEFKVAQDFAASHGLPFNVGEFGAYSTADLSSRVRWTTYLARWFESQGMSWAYWEFSAGFGIYNPSTGAYVDELVDALLHNEMPEPVKFATKVLYRSDFSQGRDGWNIVSQGGAASSANGSDNRLQVQVTNGGTEGWHVQLTKTGFSFRQGRRYQIGFTAVAEAARSATFYAGKNGDPWTAYSGYQGITIPTTESKFIFTFTMTHATDELARLVFDLGKSTAGLSIYDVVVEEVLQSVTSVEDEFESTVVYPNPARSVLFVTGSENFDEAVVFDVEGRRVSNIHFDASSRSLNLGQLDSGIYVLRLVRGRSAQTFRIVRE